MESAGGKAGKTFNLFLGGLPTYVSGDDLKAYLADFASSISIHLPSSTRAYGLNKGYAFVIVKDPVTYKQLKGYSINVEGRTLQLIDTHKEPGVQSNRVFLKGIPYNLTDGQLLRRLRQYCDCASAYSVRDGLGMSLGYGYMALNSEEETERVVRLGELLGFSPAIKIEPFRSRVTSTGEAPYRHKNTARLSNYSKFAFSQHHFDGKQQINRFYQRADQNLVTHQPQSTPQLCDHSHKTIISNTKCQKEPYRSAGVFSEQKGTRIFFEESQNWVQLKRVRIRIFERQYLENEVRFNRAGQI